MSKYIIKNCPAIYGVSLDGCKKDHYEDGTVHCQDCTDCVMKQIVESLKNKIHICKNYDTDYALGKVKCAESILRLFDIQEVE